MRRSLYAWPHQDQWFHSLPCRSLRMSASAARAVRAVLAAHPPRPRQVVRHMPLPASRIVVLALECAPLSEKAGGVEPLETVELSDDLETQIAAGLAAASAAD